ncbi:MAG: hypothetical protein HZA20_11410 [Nitrospirae bacterium]|nr:hypothetical protein [Nitrospirota bacterium]
MNTLAAASPIHAAAPNCSTTTTPITGARVEYCYDDIGNLLRKTVLDSKPSPFTFTPQTGIVRNTYAVSNAITVSGINTASQVTISGGEYSINNGAFTSTSGTVSNGDYVSVRLLSSSAFLTPTSATLTIGGVNGTFSITSEAIDTVPDSFVITDKTGTDRSAWISSGITVTGINSPAPISVSGGEYSINSGTFTSAAGTVSNGSTVTVRLMSSASFSTQTSATLSIGGISAVFNVTTDADCTGHTIRISGTAPRYFSTIQSAYNAAASGEVIQSASLTFTENLSINRAISVTLDGGYSCDYTAKTGKTTIQGRMDINSGTASVGDYNLQ